MSCRCSKDAGVPKETAATAALSHHHPYTAIPVPRFPLQVTHVCKSMRSCPSYCLSSLRRALCRYPLDCGGNFEHLRFAGRRATPHTSGIAVAECPTALQLLPRVLPTVSLPLQVLFCRTSRTGSLRERSTGASTSLSLGRRISAASPCSSQLSSKYHAWQITRQTGRFCCKCSANCMVAKQWRRRTVDPLYWINHEYTCHARQVH